MVKKCKNHTAKKLSNYSQKWRIDMDQKCQNNVGQKIKIVFWAKCELL